jgi:hypothetical protein
VPSYDCFQLVLPLIATGIVASQRPIVLADRGHKNESEVDVAVLSQPSDSATTEQPKLANILVGARPRTQTLLPFISHIHFAAVPRGLDEMVKPLPCRV